MDEFEHNLRLAARLRISCGLRGFVFALWSHQLVPLGCTLSHSGSTAVRGFFSCLAFKKKKNELTKRSATPSGLYKCVFYYWGNTSCLWFDRPYWMADSVQNMETYPAIYITLSNLKYSIPVHPGTSNNKFKSATSSLKMRVLLPADDSTSPANYTAEQKVPLMTCRMRNTVTRSWRLFSLSLQALSKIRHSDKPIWSCQSVTLLIGQR